MNIDFVQVIQEYIAPVVVIACLVVGYILKHAIPQLKNDYIPCILALVGAILNPIVNGLDVNTVVYGALMGLASTGLHQAFSRFVEGIKDGKENSEN